MADRESADPALTVIDNAVKPRLTLVVLHSGAVSLSTCDNCLGTHDELIEALEIVLEGVRRDKELEEM